MATTPTRVGDLLRRCAAHVANYGVGDRTGIDEYDVLNDDQRTFFANVIRADRLGLVDLDNDDQRARFLDLLDDLDDLDDHIDACRRDRPARMARWHDHQ